MEIDRAKLHRIMEFVKQGGCHFDPGDATESLWMVLERYGIMDELTALEEIQLAIELEALAGQCQTSEMVYQVAQKEKRVIDW